MPAKDAPVLSRGNTRQESRFPHLGAVAAGVLALGVVAIGALAAARFIVGRLSIRQAQLRDRAIENLTAPRWRVIAGQPRNEAGIE
jgi:hypothetical protein